METYEKNQLIKNRVITYLKEGVNSGRITEITNFEIESIEMNTVYDESMKMYLIEETIWNKLPESVQQDIKTFYK